MPVGVRHRRTDRRSGLPPAIPYSVRQRTGKCAARTRHATLVVVLLVVPRHPLDKRQPDEHFAPEAAAAKDLGIDVALVDHDALLDPASAPRALRAAPTSDDALYRGWMLRSEQYERFFEVAADSGVGLRTAPDAYRRSHELPGWYGAFEQLTPLSLWTETPSTEEFVARCRQLGTGPAVIKDFVKSMKHYWAEACFVPAVEDTDSAVAVARRFLDLRADDLVGGLVIRRFEEFAGPEVRTWWIEGRCALITPHPDDPDAEVPDDMEIDAVASAVATLGSPFLTVDLARRIDGVWRVIEVGDGQVSDRPTSTAPGELLALLVR